METCYNHPNKIARVRCKTCHRPVCEECQLVTELGSFCSEACATKAKSFTERVSTVPPPPRRKGGFMKFVKRLFLLGILLVILYVVVIYRTGSFENFINQINSLIRMLF